MDVTEDMDIIHASALISPLKKKRGRLRKEPTPKASTNARQSRGAPPKVPKPETDSFTIPEGFLEILEGEGGKKEPPPRKSRGRKKLAISTPSVHSSESESAPIKRSSRIQAQQKKKMSELAVEMEKEQRMLELLAKKSSSAAKKGLAKTPPAKAKSAKSPIVTKSSFEPPTPEDTCMETKRKPRKMNSRSRNMTKMTLMYEDESKDSEFSTSRETEKSKRGRRKGRGSGKKGYKPWDLSSESESSIEEITEEEEEEEEPEEPLVFEVNEDEFACEELDEDAEPIVVRRARTAKKVPEGSTAEEPVVNDDKPCCNCGKYDQPEWILLCDKCDNGYHTHCLKPPLSLIPDGDWYCQPCEHMFLCEWLQKEVHDLELVIKQREREELRKQRLAYVGISLDNVLKPEKKEESDASSNEEDSEEDADSKGRSRDSSEEERKPKKKKSYAQRSVRARGTVNYQFKEYDALIASAIQDEIGIDEVKLTEDEEEKNEEESEKEDDKPFKAKISRPRKKTKRLNDLDFSDEDIDSGDEYKGSSSDSEQTAPPSGSESGESGESGDWKAEAKKGKGKSKTRKGRRGRSSDEDWEESDSGRPTTRRAARKPVSYRELSSDEEWSEKPKKTAKKRKIETESSEESNVSYKKKKPKQPKQKQTKRKSRVRKWASSDSSEESDQSMSFSGDDSSQKSEDEWKSKKSSGVSSRLKTKINKKVLSSEEEEEEDENEESSREPETKKPAPKKKIVSEEEEESDEEEEGDEDEEESDDEEDEEDEEEEESEEETKEAKPKPEEKPKVKTVEKPAPPNPVEKPAAKPEVEKPPKVVEPPKIVEKTEPKPAPVAPPIPDLEKIKAAPILEKAPSLPVPAPVRTVKKDTTKMVPCVIPYDKPPKTVPTVNPEEEFEKERAKGKESGVLRTAPKPFGKTLPPKSVAPHPAARPAVMDRRPFKSTIIQPFSNIDDDGIDSDDEVPLERIPTNVVPTPPAPSRRESEYIPAAKGYSYTAPDEKCFPPPPHSYSPLAPFQDYGSRPSPLKPSLVETYSNSSSPSKLTPLDSYSQTSSPKGFISLDSYSESRKMKKQHFYGNQPSDHPDIRPPRDTYNPQGGEIRFPPEPYPCTSSPGTYRTPPPPGTPPRLYSQYQDSYAPPRSPDYYQNHQYYSDDRVPRPSGYQPNYIPPEPSFVTNPYVATPVPQPNGGFMIDTLLRARNPENEEDELTEVTDIVSYITQE